MLAGLCLFSAAVRCIGQHIQVSHFSVTAGDLETFFIFRTNFRPATTLREANISLYCRGDTLGVSLPATRWTSLRGW